MTRRIVLIVISAALIVGAGFMHGRLTNRWGEAQELVERAALVHRVGENVGDWSSQSFQVDERQLKLGEIIDYVSRQYVNRKTGEQVRILMICGRPGPVSVHTPDICYQAAGYVMGPKTLHAIRGVMEGGPPEFWGARFTKEGEAEPLHILWGWSAGGRFIAPDHPRLFFYREPVIYKLYVIRPAKTLDGPLVDDVVQVFLKDFLPEVRRVFAGQAEEPAAPPAANPKS